MNCNIIYVFLYSQFTEMIISSEISEQFFPLLEKSRRIAVVTHLNPDGDAVGSAVAMESFLTDLLGKQAKVIFSTEIPAQCRFVTEGSYPLTFLLSRDEATDWISGSDLIICLDCSSFSRTGAPDQLLRERDCCKVLIDHHLNPESDTFDLCVSRIEISSASELLFHLLKTSPLIDGDVTKLPSRCRTALLTGMTTDTNNFANSVFPSTMLMCSELIAAGTDREAVLEHIYNEYGENRIRAIGYLLHENMKITADGLAYIIVDKETIERFRIKDGDLEGLVNMPLAIKEVKMSILLKEDEGFFRVSIRSMRGISANSLARDKFNGGGHEQAAGGRLYFPGDIASREEAARYLECSSTDYLK